MGNKETWKAHKASFAPILKDLIAQGLFRNEKELKTFFNDLELQSEPATDQDGRLILKVKYYGQDRILLGITRLNLLAGNIRSGARSQADRGSHLRRSQCGRKEPQPLP
ncbi:MAG: hypothetical protein IPK98_10825 [Chloracidobacterium sp.]|nr:hypothetical protein [Chloracidobacterium sp.]